MKVKFVYVLSPNKRMANRYMKQWDPFEGWTEIIEHGGISKTLKQAQSLKADNIKTFADRRDEVKTEKGKKHRKECIAEGINGWWSWTANRCQKEVTKIRNHKIYKYEVPTYGYAFKRVTP